MILLVYKKIFNIFLRSIQSFYTAIYRTRNIDKWYLLVLQLQKRNAKEAWTRNIHSLYSLEHSFDIYLKRQKFIMQVFYFKVIYSQLFNLLFYGINYFKLSKYLLQNSKYFIFKEIYFKVKILAKVLFKLAKG